VNKGQNHTMVIQHSPLDSWEVSPSFGGGDVLSGLWAGGVLSGLWVGDVLSGLWAGGV